MIDELDSKQTKHFQSFDGKISKVQSDVSSIRDDMHGLESDFEELESEYDTLKEENNRMKIKLEDRDKTITDLRKNVQYLEDYNRRYNLIIAGIPELSDEKCEDVVRSFFFTQLHHSSAATIGIDITNRLCSKKDGSPRDTIVKFITLTDRNAVWSLRKKLSGSKYYLREHFSPETEAARKMLYPYYKAALSENKKAKLSGDSLMINGKRYSIENLPDLQPTHTIATDEHIFFHGRESIFSNFYPVKLILNDKAFNCVEQYFQYELVMLHGLDCW